MKSISILNDCIGPVMRGPSSSHTAGAFHIGCLARSLLGEPPVRAAIAFDGRGSYGTCFREQGADLALAAGLLGWSMTDERFFEALAAAASRGLSIRFDVRALEDPEHPNAVDIDLAAAGGRTLALRAHSTGGGAIEIVRIDGWPVRFFGDAHEIAVEIERGADPNAADLLASDGEAIEPPARHTRGERSFVAARRRRPLPEEVLARLHALPGARDVRIAKPVFFVPRGIPLFASAADAVRIARERGISLGRIGLAHEASLLALPEGEILAEMGRRFDVMRRAVERGLGPSPPPMQLLEPSAGRIFDAEAGGRLAIGGIHARAAARALAALHTSSGMGVVCAAPTGGSSGVLPGVIVTWADERGIDREGAALALLAAGAVGVAIASRATFAAEVAGCQVEIGAAGAMAAAAVIELSGGGAERAADAAAIALQDAVGSVCDLVQGFVEIPCHTRNAAAASHALLCADLILGGYANPIPLDETIDAAYAVGRMLPEELRCTARGGLAMAPSARAMCPRRRDRPGDAEGGR
ncbi:MAG: L-serine ammonia-lyase, iron-sulfur-dependent, subunit alpha [Planctomycetes bacterium]|nr:L-serine ammonia-lyase, iron-sulfur-dependent, subunit alpha [Planctomycetota bacterium]